MVHIDDFLEHYGKKGMKWGVVNNDELGRVSGGSKGSDKPKDSFTSSSMSSAAKAYLDSLGEDQIQADGLRKLAAQASAVHDHKRESSSPKGGRSTPAKDVEKGGLTTKQKVAIGVGAAAAAGLIAYYGHQVYKGKKIQGSAPKYSFNNTNSGHKPKPTKQATPARKDSKSKLQSEMGSLFGKQVQVSDSHLTKPNETGGFFQGLKGGAFDRPEFEIPSHMTFNRLSDHQETGKSYGRSGAYATFLSNDKNLYASSGEFGGKKYSLEFKADKPVKVPSTMTVINELKKVLESDGTIKYSEKDVMAEYYSIAGSGWDSKNSKALIGGLKKLGFSALVDDMDAGYLGDLPLYFFGDVSEVKATPRSSNAQKKAWDSAIPPVKLFA